MTERMRHVLSDEEDDDAVWIIPGGDSLPDPSVELPTVSPWRLPAVLRQSRDVRVKGLLRAARGPSFLGIVDFKVLFWVISHVGVPIVLICVDANVRNIFAVAFRLDSGPRTESNSGLLASERLVVAAFFGLTAGSLWLFGSLYCSDPGWIQPGAPALDADPQRPPCALCGETPSLRSHHDKHTGQCVHKHDHHCWFLSATIGDRNHSRFLALMAVEVTLLGWLMVLVLPTVMRCGALQWPAGLLRRHGWSTLAGGGAGGSSGVAGAGTGGCPEASGLLRLWVLWMVLVFGAAWLALVGHLLLLHAYLAATNQTTLELLKGPRLPFLARAFAALPASQCGPGGRHPTMLDSRGNVSLFRIAQQHLRGATPPRPFDEGLWRNLWIFFLARKPYPYRFRTTAIELA